MRRKGNLFIADAETIILSCNGRSVMRRLKHAEELDLELLHLDYPFDPLAEPIGAISAPAGWKRFESWTGVGDERRLQMSWAEDIATHDPLGFSPTRRDKTSPAVKPVLPTDRKRG